MITALVPAEPRPPALPYPDLVAAFLEGRKATTLDAYRRSLEDFALFLPDQNALHNHSLWSESRK